MSQTDPSLFAMVSPEALSDAYRRALDSHSIVSVSDTKGVIRYANDKFCQVMGYGLNDLIGQSYSLINSDRNGADFFESLWATVNSGKSWVGEVCNRAKDGRYIWFDNIVVPLYDAQNTVTGHLSVRKDITNRKSVEEKLQRNEQFLLDVSEIAEVGGWSLDLQSNELFWSDQTKRIHDVPLDFEPQLDKAIDFYAPEARGAITHAVENSIGGGESWDLELPMITAKKRYIWVRAVGHAIFDDSGKAIGLVGAFQDITKRKMEEDILRGEVSQRHNAEQLLRDILETLPDAVAAYDEEDRLIVCNSAYLNTYAASAEAITPGATFESIIRFGLARGQYSDAGTDADSQEAWLNKRLKDHRNPPEQLTQKLSDGTWLQVREHVSVGGSTVGVRTDITGLKRAEAELRRYAETDQLTGLLNRRSFSARLDATLEEFASGGQTGGCVALFDIDHFKPINDAYGHDVGDEVLVELARRLNAILGPDDFAARLGGDEFVFVLTNRDGQTGYEDVIIDYFERMREPIMTMAGKITTGISLGLVEFEGVDTNSRSLMKYADLAQYRAKEEGRGQWYWFATADAAKLQQAAELGKALAADMGELAFTLQPIAGAHDAEALGFSVEPSWTFEGSVYDSQTLKSLAQKCGLVAKLCRLGLETAMIAIGDAQARGADTGQLWISASADHMKLDPFVSLVERLRMHHGLEASSVTFAVDEAALIDRSATAIETTFLTLGQHGYRVAVDNFGSQACSLATLERLGVHAVRFDPALTDPLADPQAEDRLVRGLVAMASVLEIDILASGVASPRHAARLASLGFAAFQGPLLGQAVPTDDLPLYLADMARRRLSSVLDDHKPSTKGKSAA
ncbi:MAG: diguanylate cyclase [Pseudomonadota bacterium]